MGRDAQGVGSVVQMHWGHRRAISTKFVGAGVLVTVTTLVLPVGSLSAREISPAPDALEVPSPTPSTTPGDVLRDVPDGGETAITDLSEALRSATPEEIEERRAEIAKRLAEAGSAQELARRTEAEATAALAKLDTELAAAQERVVTSRAKVATAMATQEQAEEKYSEAKEQAVSAEAQLRRAAVDLFINPPQADSVRAALSGTVEEEMVSTGLLVGRADTRRELSDQADAARDAAARAKRAADRASEAADVARTEAEQSAEDLADQLALRNAQLEKTREDLALMEAEVSDLQLTDSVLATRLALNGLSDSGSVTAVQGPDGNWVPIAQGLPTRADMVTIPGTSMSVHNLIAPNVYRMVVAAFSDGVVLAGSAYRDPLRQIQLRASHCGSSYAALFTAPSSSCSPPTARPGQSMHERGLAIDFTEGGSVLTRSSASFKWLSEHAAEYGFYNLPSEAWHWSVNGH